MGKYGTSFIKRSQVCQGSARTHTCINYLVVSLRGQGDESNGGEVWQAPNGRHELPQGGFKATRSRLTPALTQRDVFSCVQTVTGNLDRKSELPFLTLQSFPRQERREMPFFLSFFSRKIWYHTGKTWLVICHTCHTTEKISKMRKKRRCKLKSCFHTYSEQGLGMERQNTRPLPSVYFKDLWSDPGGFLFFSAEFSGHWWNWYNSMVWWVSCLAWCFALLLLYAQPSLSCPFSLSLFVSWTHRPQILLSQSDWPSGAPGEIPAHQWAGGPSKSP